MYASKCSQFDSLQEIFIHGNYYGGPRVVLGSERPDGHIRDEISDVGIVLTKFVGGNTLTAVSSILQGPHSNRVTSLSISHCCCMDDYAALSLAEMLTGNTTMRRLKFIRDEQITSTGWNNIFTSLMLFFRYSGLEEFHLILGDVEIDNNVAVSLFISLKESCTLKKIVLGADRGIASICRKVFGKAICDPSSIEATYASNHTLQHIEILGSSGEVSWPSDDDQDDQDNEDGDDDQDGDSGEITLPGTSGSSRICKSIRPTIKQMQHV